MTWKQFDQDNKHLNKCLRCSPPCAMHMPGCRRELPRHPLKISFTNLGSSSRVTNLYTMSKIWTNRQTKATGHNHHLTPDSATSQYVRGRGNPRRLKANPSHLQKMNRGNERDCQPTEYMNVGFTQHAVSEEPVVVLLVEEEWVVEAESHLAIEEEVDPRQV